MSKDVKRCRKMSKDVKRCRKMSKDVERCRKMSKNVERCRKMSKNVDIRSGGTSDSCSLSVVPWPPLPPQKRKNFAWMKKSEWMNFGSWSSGTHIDFLVRKSKGWNSIGINKSVEQKSNRSNGIKKNKSARTNQKINYSNQPTWWVV